MDDFYEELTILIAKRYSLQDQIKQNNKDIDDLLERFYVKKETSATSGTTSFDFRFE